MPFQQSMGIASSRRRRGLQKDDGVSREKARGFGESDFTGKMRSSTMKNVDFTMNNGDFSIAKGDVTKNSGYHLFILDILIDLIDLIAFLL